MKWRQSAKERVEGGDHKDSQGLGRGVDTQGKRLEVFNKKEKQPNR